MSYALRMCLVCDSGRNLKWIFEEENREILTKLRYVAAPSRVEIDDCLLQYICMACASMLESIYQFKFLYEETYNKYKSNLKHIPMHASSSWDLLVSERRSKSFMKALPILRVNEEVMRATESFDKSTVTWLHCVSYQDKGEVELECIRGQTEKVSHSVDLDSKLQLKSELIVNDDVIANCEEEQCKDNRKIVEEDLAKENIRPEVVTEPLVAKSFPLRSLRKRQPKCTIDQSIKPTVPVKKSLKTPCLNQKTKKTIRTLRKSRSKHIISRNNFKPDKVSYQISEIYKCNVCEKSFETDSLFRKHKALHSNVESKKRQKRKCEKKKYKTNPYKYKCEVCKKLLKQSKSLKAHRILHANPDIYKCEICNSSFSYERTFKQHKALHDNPDRYKCKICSKSFTRPAHFKAHKAWHDNPDVFKCEICNKQFQHPWNMKNHKASHNLGVIKCNKCNKIFTQKRSLKRHLADPKKCT